MIVEILKPSPCNTIAKTAQNRFKMRIAGMGQRPKLPQISVAKRFTEKAVPIVSPTSMA
ncbi:hypothetical protein [uncultured Nostoc sp.]|uniref:hypothetical protein n=1 Tax=uncultured Nostoc sp. TaxID=340711 RepID=UPI0035CB1C2A